jgi:hypothetical protein
MNVNNTYTHDGKVIIEVSVDDIEVAISDVVEQLDYEELKDLVKHLPTDELWDALDAETQIAFFRRYLNEHVTADELVDLMPTELKADVREDLLSLAVPRVALRPTSVPHTRDILFNGNAVGVSMHIGQERVVSLHGVGIFNVSADDATLTAIIEGLALRATFNKAIDWDPAPAAFTPLARQAALDGAALEADAPAGPIERDEDLSVGGAG